MWDLRLISQGLPSALLIIYSQTGRSGMSRGLREKLRHQQVHFQTAATRSEQKEDSFWFPKVATLVREIAIQNSMDVVCPNLWERQVNIATSTGRPRNYPTGTPPGSEDISAGSLSMFPNLQRVCLCSFRPGAETTPNTTTA
jgi:hypothetical protein